MQEICKILETAYGKEKINPIWNEISQLQEVWDYNQNLGVSQTPVQLRITELEDLAITAMDQGLLLKKSIC
ncbi:MAG: hypothetical protein HWD61_12805 [Parachlamydiaceae bacterium]|nr:MAG: hypothetical protein HWD61_12805 [Parachlamydiaceae bacterium]